jgi:hypothetical protein
MNPSPLSGRGRARGGAPRGAPGSSLTSRGRGTSRGIGSPRTPTQASSSASLLARQVASINNINYVSGGSSQRVTENAPVLNRERDLQHNPPTKERLPYSPRGRAYLPPTIKDEADQGVDSFPDPCERNFNAYLAASNSRKIFTLEKRGHYRRHLRDPMAGA